jgi:hypothetical protein
MFLKEYFTVYVFLKKKEEEEVSQIALEFTQNI